MREISLLKEYYLVVRKQYILIFGLVALLGFLQYQLWFDQGSILDIMKNRQRLQTQIDINKALQAANVKLRMEVEHLKKDSHLVEEKARHDLGMIKEGETYYRIVE